MPDSDRSDLKAGIEAAQEAVSEVQRMLDNLTTAPVEKAEGVTTLAQLENTIAAAIDLIGEAAGELSEKQGARLQAWAVPLDALRAEVRRTRGQVEGPLREVKYA